MLASSRAAIVPFCLRRLAVLRPCCKGVCCAERALRRALPGRQQAADVLCLVSVLSAWRTWTSSGGPATRRLCGQLQLAPKTALGGRLWTCKGTTWTVQKELPGAPGAEPVFLVLF